MSSIEIINNNGHVIIDDKYRYLSLTRNIELNNGANNPTAMSSFDSSYGKMFYMRTLQYNKLDVWMYIQGGPFIEYGTHKRYMAYIFEAPNNRLYGIKFKKESTEFDVYIRLTPTLIGNFLTGKTTARYLLVEIATNDTDSEISKCNAYRDYYDIVEIGNNKDTIPKCNVGIEIYAANGQAIWNSCCATLNVKESYTGQAGNLCIQNITKNTILIPNYSYKRASIRITDHLGKINPYESRDFFKYKNSQIINTVLTFEGTSAVRKYVKHKASIWDPREFGCDTNTDICGFIVS